VGLVLFLKALFTAVAVVAAVSYRAKYSAEAPRAWYYAVLPVALGSPAVFLPLPIYLWTVAAWAAGLAPAIVVQRRRLDARLPWKDWFGPSRYVGGSRLLLASQVARETRRRSFRFALGGVPFPQELEPVHTLMVGTTGSGKTVAIKTVLDQAEAAGQRVVAVDSGADLATRYYSAERGDVILNPLDSRCVAWSPLAEIRNLADCMAVARSICPTGEGADKTWTLAAQNFLAAIFEKMLDLPAMDAANGRFLHFVAVADLEELRAFLAGTSAAPYLAEGNERMFGSVRSTAMERTAAFFLLEKQASRAGFSIRNWIAEDGKSWLFATYLDDQLEMLRFLISTVIDIAAIATLSLTQNPDRRVFFSLDEFDSIGKVDSVVSLLTKGRKYGAAVIIGIQTIAQLRKNYAHDGAQTITGNLGSWAVLLTPDPETAKYVSDKLGTGDWERRTHQISHSKGGGGVSSGVQVERGIPAVPPGDILTLPRASRETRTPPQGYLHLSGLMPCRITLDFPPARPDRDAPDAQERFGFRMRADFEQQKAVFEQALKASASPLEAGLAALLGVSIAPANEAPLAEPAEGLQQAEQHLVAVAGAEPAENPAKDLVAGLAALDALGGI
jgi:type IV secretory pathway TraG/TraD family ATPase VirD4